MIKLKEAAIAELKRLDRWTTPGHCEMCDDVNKCNLELIKFGAKWLAAELRARARNYRTWDGEKMPVVDVGDIDNILEDGEI